MSKKIFALSLAIILCLAVSLPVFAEDPQVPYTETLQNRTNFYDQTDDTYPEGYFEPQEVTVLTIGDGDWLQIATGLGPKWINTTDTASEYVINDTMYYYSSQSSTTPAGYLAPQTVISLVTEGDWRLINTSEGLMWLDTTSSTTETTLNLTDTTYFYAQKGGTEPEGYFEIQEVVVLEQDVDWYLISTSLGPKWVNTNNTVSTRTLLSDTYYYAEKDGTEKLGYFGPQEVNVLQEDGDWIQIASLVGPVWLNTADTVVTSYELTETSYFYTNYGDENPEGFFAPQTVTVLSQNGDWYKIISALGDRWIYPTKPNESLDLTADNTYYFSELYGTEAEGSFNAQTVEVFVQDVNDPNWYLINTFDGPKWIDITNTFPD